MVKRKAFKKGKNLSNTAKKGQISKTKRKGEVSSKDSFRDSALNIKVKGTWKSVDVDYNLFTAEELNEFDGVEELTDYELVRGLTNDEVFGDETDCTTSLDSNVSIKLFSCILAMND